MFVETVQVSQNFGDLHCAILGFALCLCLSRLFVVLPGNCVSSSLRFLKRFLQSDKVSDKRDVVLFLRLEVPKDSKQIKLLRKHVQK